MSDSELPDAKIVETTVLPDASGVTVRLQISDESLHSESEPKFHLTLSVRLPNYEVPLFAQLEREAIDLADSVLQHFLREKAAEIRRDRSRDLRPAIRHD